MIIRLTGTKFYGNKPIWINTNYIVRFYDQRDTDSVYTRVVLLTEGVNVKETPEQILKLMDAS